MLYIMCFLRKTGRIKVDTQFAFQMHFFYSNDTVRLESKSNAFRIAENNGKSWKAIWRNVASSHKADLF